MYFKIVGGIPTIKYTDFRGKVPAALAHHVKVYLAWAQTSRREFLTKALWDALPPDRRPPAYLVWGGKPEREV